VVGGGNDNQLAAVGPGEQAHGDGNDGDEDAEADDRCDEDGHPQAAGARRTVVDGGRVAPRSGGRRDRVCACRVTSG